MLTRKEPLDVDGVNLSIIAHVTPEELLNNLTATDRCNGFANRFLIVLVRRSKFLPEGGGDANTSRSGQRRTKVPTAGMRWSLLLWRLSAAPGRHTRREAQRLQIE